MEELFKKLQKINTECTVATEKIFEHCPCQHCGKSFESTDSVYICEVLSGYIVCGNCYSSEVPPRGGYCVLIAGDDEEKCKPLKLDEGWHYEPSSGLTCCLAHPPEEMNEFKFQFIAHPRAYIREVTCDQLFYRERYANQVIYDEPVDVKNLRLPEVLPKDIAKIRDLCFPWYYEVCDGREEKEVDLPWWHLLEKIDGYSTGTQHMLAFKKYGALRAWMPFDEVDIDTPQSKEPVSSYCFLVYCDSSKEIFGQVMMLKIFECDTCQAYGTGLSVHQYLEKKYELLTTLETLLVDFPTALVKIIWEHADDGMKLVEYVCNLIK